MNAAQWVTFVAFLVFCGSLSWGFWQIGRISRQHDKWMRERGLR